MLTTPHRIFSAVLPPGQTFCDLVELLRLRASERPDAVGYTYLTDGEGQEVRLTYGELDRRARAVAARLQTLGSAGERAVLLFPPDLDYLVAFFGCLYAGVVAVPAYPPSLAKLHRSLPRIRGIAADAGAKLVLTTSSLLASSPALFEHAPEFREKLWVATDALVEGEELSWSPPPAGGERLAFLQYTSGSTGAPRGVMLTHANLLHNMELISSAFDVGPRSVGVSWLPPYHDMGLIGGILAPLFRGRPTALMSPLAFVLRPIRWLEAVSRLGATISGGPNFAYELLSRRASPEDVARLDLSRWEVAFCGAEPVHPTTIDRFCQTFEPCGFRRQAFYACYGLAEATLIVSGGAKAEPPVLRSVDAAALQRGKVACPSGNAAPRSLVGCGRALGGQEVAIVDPATRVGRAEGELGEIWIRGPSVARGYWNEPSLSQATFGASRADTGEGPFLRTGDLGFTVDGELFIAGRLKDLIIVRGRNHYPQDIERTAEESHPAVRQGCCAAISIVDGEEGLTICAEVERRFRERRRLEPPLSDGGRRSTERRAREEDIPRTAPPQSVVLEDVLDAIERAVADEHGVRPRVVLLKAGTIPKTSSGKIQRDECRRALLGGALEALASSHGGAGTEADAAPASVEEALSSRPEARGSSIAAFLAGRIARALDVPTARIAHDLPLRRLGLDSIMAVELVQDLERELGAVLPLTSFLGELTLAELTRRVITAQAAGPSAIPAAPDAHDFPLTAGQEALWFLQKLAPASGAYNVPCAARVRARLDVPALQGAFQMLQGRHESLRMRIGVLGGRPFQRVLDEPLDLKLVDAGGLDEGALSRLVSEAAWLPFDLEREAPFRVTLFSRAEDDHVLLIAAHHVAADFWSLVVLLGELRAMLSSGSLGAPPAMRIRDFNRLQEEFLRSPEAKRAWEYWARKLAAPPPPLDLPAARRRPPLQSFRGGSSRLVIDPHLATRIRDLARAEGATPYALLLAAFELLLAQYASRESFLLGSPVASRTRAGFEQVVGYFVNSVVLRADLTGDPTFSQLVARVREDALGALEHHELPFNQLVERFLPQRDPSRPPFFQVMFGLEKTHRIEELDLSLLALGVPGVSADLHGIPLASFELRGRPCLVDLHLNLVDGGDRFYGFLDYCADIFSSDAVAQMAQDYLELLRRAVAEPHARAARLGDGLRAAPRPAGGKAGRRLAAVVPRPIAIDPLVVHPRGAPAAAAVESGAAQPLPEREPPSGEAPPQ